MDYPRLDIRLPAIRKNAACVAAHCAAHGITAAGVVKFSDGDVKIARAYYRGGIQELCGSRPAQLQRIKTALPEAKTMLLRIPMLCEVAETIRWCDTSLNSEETTLRALNDEAARQGKRHSVLLMLDVGDLREGVMTREELVRLALVVEKELPHLYLRGVGSSFGCVGSVQPDRENLGTLVAGAEAVEVAVGRPLETISGGSSGALLAIRRGEVPPRVNHMRIGGYIANPLAMRRNRGYELPGMDEDTFLLHVQLVEVNDKPSVPFGNIRNKNWKGIDTDFEDRGVCRRGIAAVGESDVGEVRSLIPTDPGVQIIGGSSDHLVLRLCDSEREYKVGDTVTFRMYYSALMRSFYTSYVEKRYEGEDQ